MTAQLHDAPHVARHAAQWMKYSPLTKTPLRPVVIMLLVLVSCVAWRKGFYYSGGMDAVVMAKAALTGLALLLGIMTPRPPDAWAQFRATPLLLLAAYLSCAALGGIFNGDMLATLVLAIRVGILATVIVLVVVSFPWDVVVRATSRATLLLAGVACATGVGTIAETGRWYGGIPPINANEICLLVSVVVLALTWKLLDEPTWPEYAFMGLLLAVVWLTGARNGLAALVVGGMLLVVLSRRLSTFFVGLLSIAIPAVIYITFFTPYISNFASRNAGNITTLNSRTVAWQAALDYADTTRENIFGQGLSQKVVPVRALYRDEQVLDSSWISAILQSGYLGVSILALFAVVVLIRGFMLPEPQRALGLGFIGLVLMTSLMQSGLVDTKPAFIIFFLMAMQVHRVPDPPEAK